ncbi:MAG: RagB/SusD family nutrient uptake outer membrane protein [Tannerellaceae bacterium]|nr:RagB/SusD family nutrient uptake outer membrane protein [Tannerellaceae bacterium]
MKTLKYNLLIMAGVAFSLVSCGDGFLDSVSKTEVLDENFYQTTADAEMALIGCYDGYQRVVADGGIGVYLAAEVMSDNCFGGTGNSDSRTYQVIDRHDPSQAPSENDIFNTTWTSYYAGIYRCNVLLQKLDDIKELQEDVTTRNRIEGETRFLRGLMYFDMVRMFENIPLLTEPSTENIPQAEPVEVYQQIVEDLKYAAQNIPADAYPKANYATNDGRVTPYAAKALLARVYLFYNGYYGNENLGLTQAEALAGLEDVINSGEYELVPEFKSLWPAASYVAAEDGETLDRSGYAGKGNIETIFAQKFNNTSNYNGDLDGNRWLVMMGMRNTSFCPYGRGWGAATVNPALVNAFASNDLRKTASIIDIVGEGIYPTFDLHDQREYTGYTVKKYTPTSLPDGTDDVGGEMDFQISQDQDYVVIRYADVLLMAAELGSPNAQKYYDEVRSRAGLATRTVSKENILEERRFEFAFEGHRYWDLLRQGIEVAANTIAQNETTLSGGIDDQVTISAQNIIARRGFLQIPGTQITLSGGVLTQNTGW